MSEPHSRTGSRGCWSCAPGTRRSMIVRPPFGPPKGSQGTGIFISKRTLNRVTGRDPGSGSYAAPCTNMLTGPGASTHELRVQPGPDARPASGSSRGGGVAGRTRPSPGNGDGRSKQPSVERDQRRSVAVFAFPLKEVPSRSGVHPAHLHLRLRGGDRQTTAANSPGSIASYGASRRTGRFTPTSSSRGCRSGPGTAATPPISSTSWCGHEPDCSEQELLHGSRWRLYLHH